MSETTTLSPVDWEQRGIETQQKFAAIVITDQSSYDVAVRERTNLKTVIEEAGVEYDGDIAKANELHKSLIAKKKTICAPFENALKSISAALVRWDDEQERIRLAEQRRLEEEARKQAENDRIAEAEAMKAQGADKETIDAVLDAPIEVTVPVVAAPTYAKSSAVVMRDKWGGEVTDLFKLVQYIAKNKQHLNLVQINQPALTQLSRALKDSMSIPGIKAVNKRGAASGRG